VDIVNKWEKEEVPKSLVGQKVCCHGVSLFKDCPECAEQMKKEDEDETNR
jgi:hypothetical protein